jgi:hypothetical protein
VPLNGVEHGRSTVLTGGFRIDVDNPISETYRTASCHVDLILIQQACIGLARIPAAKH